MAVEDKTLDRVEEVVKERVQKVLDAKVEALWQLGEPKLKTRMPISSRVPVITDIEQGVAHEAVQAITEKYGIKKHDLYMFRRAHLMEIYYMLTRGFPARVELGPDIDAKINWQ